MIEFVFNGYYRSGTTIFYKILSDSNPEKLVLFEPLKVNLRDAINNTKAEIWLHGFDPVKPYKKLPKDFIEEYLDKLEAKANEFKTKISNPHCWEMCSNVLLCFVICGTLE